MQRCFVWTALLAAAAGTATSSAAELEFLPGFARLDGPKARQRFLVESRDRGAFVADRTRDATFKIVHPRIASVAPDGTVTPGANGATELAATVDGRGVRETLSADDQ